ncbi:MAG: phosphoribosylformylglycinamidine cyclo-ligase, partial [Pseudomonadota bacterium]
VIEGIADGCRQAGCALIGGETAEMPGMYAPGDFDLAGFAVGAMERDGGLPHPVQPGDVILGLPSSGVHSNGYSLVRRIVESSGLAWDAPAPFADGTLGPALLEPTRIYTPAARALRANGGLRALAHITGGGVTENLPRALPRGTRAAVDLTAWDRPGVFEWLVSQAGLPDDEALKTFNCGVGLAAIMAPESAAAAQEALDRLGTRAPIIGTIEAQEDAKATPRVTYTGRL